MPEMLEWAKTCENLGIIVGESERMAQIYSLADKIAKKDLSVLITGETGTGKDMMARFIHHASKRKDNPFFAINCGAVVETLLESELFGHEKGAFTGAGQQRKGIFQLVDKGTLFLDEIGEASPAIQVKLLRAIETGEFLPVGGEKKLYSDVRIVAATNVNLEQAVEKNTFRRDLFFRLDVVRIDLPPLRERREDIPLIAEEILARKSRKGANVPKIAPKTILVLKEYHWPGNIRELINVMEQAIALTEGDMILPKHLPEKLWGKNKKLKVTSLPSLQEIAIDIASYSEEQLGQIYRELDFLKTEIEKKNPHLRANSPQISLAEMEEMLIADTLQRCNGNITMAAKLLGVGRNTLYRKIEKLKI